MFADQFRINTKIKALLVSIVCPNFEGHNDPEETKRSLVELKELLRTLNIETVGEVVQNRKTIEAATILGRGKLEEIAVMAKEEQAQLLVFDFELRPGQLNEIQAITSLDVVDRCHVILEIFANHARTKEAKIQIEIARLQYLLPRLKGLWGHFSRQRGGVGVLGGEGEKQIELDRRLIRERIEFMKRELKDVIKSRDEQKKRRKDNIVTAAIVGYTNAGKSSLMNRLCQVKVLEEDMLFATLDSTVRTLNPDSRPPMALIDTVGFISNLPNTLIDGFRTTLESALDADLLVIVCDISDPHFKKHLEVTGEVLEELGLKDKQQMIVFNKRDKLPENLNPKLLTRNYPGSFLVSTHHPDDMKNLRNAIINFFLDKQASFDLFIPYEQASAHASVAAKTNIINQHPHEKGIYYRVRIPDFIFQTLGLSSFILSPDDPMIENQSPRP